MSEYIKATQAEYAFKYRQFQIDETIENWVARQFMTLELPDVRLKKRSHRILQALAQRPQDSLNQVHGTWGEAKGAYRLIENERISLPSLQKPICDATAECCKGLDRIIAVQDTTTFSFDSARNAKGLGTVNDSQKSRGMFFHPVLALREDGLPLGLLDQQHWCRSDIVEHKAKDRTKRPIEEKESSKWLRGIDSSNKILKTRQPEGQIPKLVHVFDREGDVHEVFERITEHQNGAVIRSSHNRRVETTNGTIGYAHELVRKARLLGTTIIDVPRKHGESKRTAELEIRSINVVLSPRKSKHPKRCPIPLTLVEAFETNPPPDSSPLHWLLWTTEAVESIIDALDIVRIYMLRWKIEEFFLTLKQGCRIEKLQFETADRLAKTLAFYTPVAARILKCRDLARLNPDAPCTNILSRTEWHALWLKIHKKRPGKNLIPPTIKEAVLWIGRLGGHLNRKSDGMPGVRTLWLGFRDLALMAEMLRLIE